MTDQLIEFHAAAPELLRKPVAAKTLLPEWFKEISSQAQDVDAPTVKRCAPFFESLSSGYYILLEDTVTLVREPSGKLNIAAREGVIGAHLAEQVRGTPMENVPLVKFLNSWLIRTPAGYSTLFLHPLNRFHMPLTVLSGLVETDRYYREINFPALCHLAPGQSFTIPGGTPIVQLIPIKRDNWIASPGQWDFDRRKGQEDEFEVSEHMYRTTYWQPKKYS